MLNIIDRVLYLIVLSAWHILRILPARARFLIIYSIIRITFLLRPSLRKIAIKNLSIAFPNQNAEFKNEIYNKSVRNFALMFSDTLTVPDINLQWIKKHIDLSALNNLADIRAESPSGGIIFVSGHMGSFELYVQSAAIVVRPIYYVIRFLKFPRVNKFWNSIREWHGNQVIDRKRALVKLNQAVIGGKDVGILLDQNVTKNHAVFVNWFGRLAATTPGVGVIALKSRCPVVVLGLINNSDGTYKLLAEQCKIKDLYDADLSLEQKIIEVTDRASNIFQNMILKFPEGWFWFHRRWKTRPDGEKEDFYN